MYPVGMRSVSPRNVPAVFLCASLAWFASAGHAQSASQPAPAVATTPNALHFPTSEDLRHVKSMSNPLLSPDGKLVLYSIAEATADGGKTHFWLSPAEGSPQNSPGADKPRQITFAPPSDKRGERGAQWAPDGTAIYFLAKRGEHTELFRLDLRGGDASPYDLKVIPAADESKVPGAIPPPDAKAASAADKSSDKPIETKPAEEKKPDKKSDAAEPLELEVGGFAPSPDGKWLAVWGRDPETPGEKKQKDAKADASWVNHELHGTRLYLAALKPDGSVDGALKPVSIEPDVHQAVWSPNADRLLVTTEKPNDASDLGPAGAAWLVEAAKPDQALKLKAVPATVGRMAWSQNGDQLVFAAQTPEDAPPGYDELFIVSKEAAAAKDNHPRRLTAGFDGQINGSILYSTGLGLVAEAGIGTRTTPVLIAIEGKPAVNPMNLGESVANGLNTNQKQTGWTWIADSGGVQEKLCYAAKLGDACQPVATPDLIPANIRMAKPELIHWRSGNFTIEGLLYLPPTADTKPPLAKIPLIMDIHGGPFGAFEDRNDLFAAFLVGHGWAVLRPNPRGSSNYGVKFGAANKNDLGGGDYQDVMAGVDAALSKYPLDPSRMALMGYSYGGEMAGFVEGKTDRFKAIISGAPVIDQFSEYGTEGGSWYDRWYFGKPWEHLDEAWRQSPLAGAAHAKTPLLLIQGESDTTDPLGQSQEMYRALRQEGVPVELVTYPRENHGPLAGGIFGSPSPEPWHGFDGRQRIIDFIEKNFAGAPSNP
jgi:dipeptidyl aminopeptidase/acylaminoacyl peptidase